MAGGSWKRVKNEIREKRKNSGRKLKASTGPKEGATYFSLWCFSTRAAHLL